MTYLQKFGEAAFMLWFFLPLVLLERLGRLLGSYPPGA